MDDTKNYVALCGRAACEAVFSHENHGKRFYRFPLEIVRLSKQVDSIGIFLTAQQLEELQPLTGKRLSIVGQLRSFNNKSGEGSKLIITVLAREIYGDTEGIDRNYVTLKGVICKPPIFRRTPLGRCISDLMLAVNRQYGRADYLPCIAWGQVATLTGHMSVGESIALEGRIQSRNYTKVLEDCSEIRTAYEVSIMQLTDEA